MKRPFLFLSFLLMILWAPAEGRAQTISVPDSLPSAAGELIDSLVILGDGVYFREFYRDGTIVKQFNDKGLVVTVNILMTKEYFRIFRVNINIDNCTGERLQVLEGGLSAKIERKGEEVALKVYDYGEYYSRANRFESFIKASQIGGQELGSLMPSTYNVRTDKDGRVSYSMNFRNRTVTSVRRVGDGTGFIFSPAEYRPFLEESDGRLNMLSESYFKSNTLEDGEVMSCFAAAERVKGDRISVSLTLNGKSYNFTWKIDEHMISTRGRNNNLLMLLLL